MESKNELVRLQRENERMKKQISTLKNSFNILKQEMKDSKSRDGKNNASTLNSINVSTNEDINSNKNNELNRIKTPNKRKNDTKTKSVNFETLDKKSDLDINYYKYILDYNDKLFSEKANKKKIIQKYHNLSTDIEGVNEVKKLKKDKIKSRGRKSESISNNISFLKDNYISYNTSYNNIIGKMKKTNQHIKNIKSNNITKTNTNNNSIITNNTISRENGVRKGIKTPDCKKNQQTKKKRMVYHNQLNTNIKRQKSNGGKYNKIKTQNKNSYKVIYKNKYKEASERKNEDILFYLKEIKALQRVISKLKNENNILKGSLLMEKKYNRKYKINNNKGSVKYLGTKKI